MRSANFALSVLVLCAAVGCVAAVANCAGNGYDLSPLSGVTIPLTTVDYGYLFSVCGNVTEPVCGARGGSLCQYDHSEPPVYKHVLSKWDQSGVWANCTDPTFCPNGGVQVSFQNGDMCSSPNAPRSLNFLVACDPQSTSNAYTLAQVMPCTYTVQMKHWSGCRGAPGPMPPTPPGPSPAHVQPPGLFPAEILALIPTPPAPCFNTSELYDLMASPDMLARRADTSVSIPFATIRDYMFRPNLLPTYNSDYTVVNMSSFETCTIFNGHFTTKINASVPNAVFPYPIMVLVNETSTGAVFGWMFGTYSSTLNAFVTRGYHFMALFQQMVNGVEATHYISWEKMFSPFVAANRKAFEYGMGLTVLRPDFVGVNCLEQVWLMHGTLNPETVTAVCNPPPPPPPDCPPQGESGTSGMVSNKVVAGVTVPLVLITLGAVFMCMRYRSQVQTSEPLLRS